MLTKLLAALFGLSFAACAFATEMTAVRFARLIHGDGSVITDAVVVIEGERVTAVGSGNAAVPRAARVIDLRGLTGLPGLIDVHTHMTYYWDRTPGTRPWAQLGTLHSAVTLFLAQENARKTLEAGVTTVRDLGSWEYLDVAMRDLINRGAMAGPRMFVAGYGLSISNTPSQLRPNPRWLGVADGVPDVTRVAREQIAAGADWIKMYGSTGSDQDVTGFQTFSLDEMKAAADVAHRAGKRIAIHSYGPAGAADAVRAGADSIEHATDVDDGTLSAMAKAGVVYVPTISHNHYYVEHRAEYGYDDATVKRLNDYSERNLETLRHAIRLGVPVAMGSDAVFTGFGENTRELEWFVKAGMSPKDAIRSATTTAAALLGQSKELGCVTAGCYADLIAIEGDPLEDITAVTKRVRWVMKGGKVVVDSRAAARDDH